MWRGVGITGGLALGLFLVGSQGAFAATASQITPQQFTPEIQKQGAALSIPESKGLQIPEGADRISVELADVYVEGGLPEMAGETQSITSALTGQKVTAARLFMCARDLEAAYARAGYVLSRVVLPAQKVENGQSVKIIVVNGFIEKVDASSLPPSAREHVEKVAAPLIGRHDITYDEIERQLMIAGDMPGTRLRSTLAAGQERGGSVLVLDGEYNMVETMLSFDNSQSEDMGRYKTGLGFNLNSVAGEGETFYVRASGDATDGIKTALSHRPRNRILAAGTIIPIGIDGLTANIEVVDARATPQAASGTLPSGSDFNRYAFRLRYPWVRSHSLTFATEASLDMEEERDRVISPLTDLSLDRARVVRLRSDANWATPWHAFLSGQATMAFGVNILDARSAADATTDLPLSRQGADSQFQKLTVALNYNHPVDDHVSFDTKFNGQTSFNQAMLRAEQIGLETGEALSVFGDGLFQGDSGYVLRQEVQFPYAFSFGGFDLVSAPYAFGAQALAKLEQPTALERKINVAGSYGLGLRMGQRQQESSLLSNFSVEWGQLLRSDRHSKENRISFGTSVAF